MGFVLEIGETYQDYRDRNPESSFVKVYTFNSARKSMTTAVRLPGVFRWQEKAPITRKLFSSNAVTIFDFIE